MYSSNLKWLALFELMAVAWAACPKKLIIDTDFGSFDDDPVAIGLGNIFQLWGEVEILGMMSTLSDQYAPPAMNAINTFYGHPDIPIAIQKPVTNLTKDPNHPEFGDYITPLAFDWPEQIHNGANTTDPTTLYRDLLSSASNKSIVILCIGDMDNLYHLILSPPDSISPFSGSQLISQKVGELVVQANPFGQSFNLVNHNYIFAATVLNSWPSNTKLTFADDTVAGNVWLGQRLTTELPLGPGPPGNPVAFAFNTSVGNNITWRVWDVAAMYYAVRGLDDVYSYNFTSGTVFAEPDTNTIWEFNKTHFAPGGEDEQNALVFSVEGIGNVSFAERLESILLWEPGQEMPGNLSREVVCANGTAEGGGTATASATGVASASPSPTLAFEGGGMRVSFGYVILWVIATTILALSG